MQSTVTHTNVEEARQRAMAMDRLAGCSPDVERVVLEVLEATPPGEVEVMLDLDRIGRRCRLHPDTVVQHIRTACEMGIFGAIEHVEYTARVYAPSPQRD